MGKRCSIRRLNECFRINFESWDVEPVLGRPGVRRGRPVGHTKNARGYGFVRLDGVNIPLHHVVWALWYNEFPPEHMMIDHIDGDPSNNAVWNLRLATHQQNMGNKRPRPDGGILPGVELKKNGRYLAMCGFNGHNVRVGEFDCPAAAHFAYQVMHSELHAEFSYWHVWRVSPEARFWHELVQAGPPSPDELQADFIARFGGELISLSEQLDVGLFDNYVPFTGPLALRHALASEAL